MNDKTFARLLVWLPYASLLITIAAFSAGAPAKLAHLRAARPVVAENDFRDEPMMFPMRPDTRVWSAYNTMTFRTAIALK